jgi:hypothetical protein
MKSGSKNCLRTHVRWENPEVIAFSRTGWRRRFFQEDHEGSRLSAADCWRNQHAERNGEQKMLLHKNLSVDALHS